jgi:stage V sporulation protein K
MASLMAALFHAPHCSKTLGEADPPNGQGQSGIRLAAACWTRRSNPSNPLLGRRHSLQRDAPYPLLGGILFVDEAYTLNQQYVGGSDSFGLEAIDTILKYMEDNKDSLMVIVAGYQHEMSRFLESNPGLSSRFNRYIHFEDYSDNELFEVFRSMADANKYVIHKDAFVAIETVISTLRQQEYSKFSNARSIRNLFEKIIENQATRLVKINQPSRDEIQLIISDDLCDL